MLSRQPCSRPETHSDKAFALRPGTTSSSRARPFNATIPVANAVPLVGVAARNAVSSTPRVCTRSSRFGSSTSGSAVVAHRGHHRRPADPELGRDRGHGVPVLTRPGGTLPGGRVRSTPPAAESPMMSRSTSAAGTQTPCSARSASPTPASPADRRRADPAPSSGADHAAGRGPRTPGTSPPRRWSPPPAPAHRRAPTRPAPETRADPSITVVAVPSSAPGTSLIDGVRHLDREVPGLRQGTGRVLRRGAITTLH